MFIGHFGAALAAKKLDDKPSLGTMFLASQFIDLLWPVLMLAGIEKIKIEPGNSAFTPLNFIYYPFSHSLLFVLIWALLIGGIYYLIKKNLKSSVVLGALVLSHWVLDLISHVPDLPLYPGGNLKVGLGLWNFVSLTVLVEGLIFIAGAALYIFSTRAENRKGTVGLWSLLLFLLAIYITNMVSPPPPSVDAVAVVSLLQWIFVLWGYFIDSNRRSISLEKPILAGGN
ncbi:MAG: metal-dependent hydrolase [Acidobacteriota bacterium]